jgi:hypothetical protein
MNNGYYRLCLRLRAALLYVGFPLSFTACFGLHGHLQVCKSLHIFIKESALLLFLFSAFLRGPTLHVFHLCFVPVLFSFVLFGIFLLMRLSTCSLLRTKKAAKQTPYIYEDSYAPEGGHVGRNM